MTHTISHTGPWTTKGRAYKASNFGDYSCSITARQGDTYALIAKTYGGIKDEREVAEANAALIVKAVNAHEDLLKALKDANDTIRLLWQFMETGKNELQIQAICKTLNMSGEAIAKAEGGAA
jgi:hypothetical protein